MGFATILAITQAVTWAPSDISADEPSATVKACISANAPNVERAIESLSEGTDFLTQKVCGGAILDQMAEISRKRQEEQKAKMAEACKAKDAAAQNSSSGFDRRQSPWLDQMCDPSATALYDSYASDIGGYVLQMGGGSAKATSLAAQTLLQLRIARTKPR